MSKAYVDEDWIKASAWDLPTTLEELFAVSGVSSVSDRVAFLKWFLKKPASGPMPLKLRREVQRYLNEHPGRVESAPRIRRLETKAAGVPRKFEPYDPDAEDGDGDGLVQDGTPWERPGGTRIVDRAGNEIERGLNVETRPTGVRIVDADGNEVNYTPSWAGGTGDSIANIVEARPPEILNQPAEGTTPLSDHGAATLKERGLPTVREAANPNPPEPKKSTEPKKSEATEPKKSGEPIDARFDERLPGEYKITYGDREFTVVDERDSDDIASDAFSEWGEFDGNYRMRHASAALMGIAPPPADGAKQGDRQANEIVASGKWPDGNPESTATAEMSVLHASALMSVIARGDEVTDTEVFRGLAVAPDDRLLQVQEGETLSMPISAFATDMKMARNFTTAPDGDRRTVPLVLELESGAQIYGENSEPQLLQGADGEWFEANEVLTHGDFEVVGTREEGDVRVVTVRQVATYRPSGQKVQVDPPSQRSSTPRKKAEAESPMAAVGRPLGYTPGVPNLETQRGREIAGRVESVRRQNIEMFTDEARTRILEVLDEVGISVEFDWGTGEYSAEELAPLLERAGLDVDDFVSDVIETTDGELRETIEFLRQRDMLVALKEGALQGLLSDGRYKSQHETNSSMGALNPARRIRVEEEQLGVPSEIANTMRPVYGFLDDDSGEYPTDQFAPFAYGADFVLELKPELKERSTLTFGDSLDHGGVGVPMSSDRELQPGDGMAAAGQVTQEESIQNAIQNAIIIELRKAAERAEEASAAEQPRLFDDEEIGGTPRSRLRTIADDIEQMLWENPSFERWYDEIQVHGGFTTDDVVTIWTSTDEQGIPEELLDLARERGIKFRNQYGDEFP